MSVHSVYHGATIVDQDIKTVYHRPGEEALYVVEDTIFLSYEWVQLASWINDSDQTNKYEQTYHCAMRVKSGKETTSSTEFKAGYQGLELKTGSSTKTFTEEETTKSIGKTTTVHIGPYSSSYFYQKRYKFKTMVWFRLDQSNQLWTVGNMQAPGIWSLDSEVEIDSNEYLTTSRPPSGHGTISVEAKSDIVRPINVRRVEDCGYNCFESVYSLTEKLHCLLFKS